MSNPLDVEALYLGLAGGGRNSCARFRKPGGSQLFPSLDFQVWDHSRGGSATRAQARNQVMTDQHFALFDTRIGFCPIASARVGLNGTQRPHGRR